MNHEVKEDPARADALTEIVESAGETLQLPAGGVFSSQPLGEQAARLLDLA